MSRAPYYGQVVVGPPGAGKTTFCDGMQQYLRLLGREAWVVNLDPANEQSPSNVLHNNDKSSATDAASPTGTGAEDNEPTSTSDGGGDNPEALTLPYDCLFDICQEVVSLSSVMAKLNLGPNGGLLYCWEYMEAHVDDIVQALQERLKTVKKDDEQNHNIYLLLDMPGQVELYTHSTCVQNMLHRLIEAMDLRLTAVQLIDSQYCTDATKFVSAALLATTTMIRLELPMVNVLSKVDLLVTESQQQQYDLPLPLDFFTECQDLQRLIPFVDDVPITTTSSGRGEYEDKEEYNRDRDEEEDAVLDDPAYQAARRRRRQSSMYRKYTKLHRALAEIVEDYALLSFVSLDISNAESVGRVLSKIDKANGYVLLPTPGSNRNPSSPSSIQQDVFQCAIQSDNRYYESIANVQERMEAQRIYQEEQKQR